jgi:hypothetical protein
VKAVEYDPYGNANKQRSVTYLKDGTLGMVFDIWFNLMGEEVEKQGVDAGAPGPGRKLRVGDREPASAGKKGKATKGASPRAPAKLTVDFR